MLGEYDVMAVNLMAIFWPKEPPKYAVSVHGKYLVHWVNSRVYSRIQKKPITYCIKTGEQIKGIDHQGKFYKGNIVTSGMYAVCVGFHLGYDKIVIAGMPFDNTGHFYDPIFEGMYKKMNPTFRYHWIYKQAWDEFQKKSENKIRAISGSLLDCFGEVTKEWIES